MIDLPVVEKEPELELHSRILLYNHILFAISLVILAISSFYTYQIVFNDLEFGGITNAVLVFLILLMLTQVIDVFSWMIIRSKKAENIQKITSIYMIPTMIDVILIFAFGLGIISIFLRVVIWGNINPETLYFDDEDPLFNE